MEIMKTTGFEVAMTSLQVAEVTGKRHADVIRDIEDEIDKLGEEIGESIFALTSYRDKSNRNSKMYNLSRDGAMQLGARYDAKTRFKMIQRINELEQQKPKMPTTYLQALEELVAKERLLLDQKPKVEYYEKVLDSSTCYTTTQIAKEFEMTANQLNILLKNEGVQYKQSGQWLLTAKYLKMGLVDTRTHIDAIGETRHSTVWTEKGREFISEFLDNI